MNKSKRANPEHSWNQQILRNLRFKFGPKINHINDRDVLTRFYFYSEVRDGPEIDEDLLTDLLDESIDEDL